MTARRRHGRRRCSSARRSTSMVLSLTSAEPWHVKHSSLVGALRASVAVALSAAAEPAKPSAAAHATATSSRRGEGGSLDRHPLLLVAAVAHAARVADQAGLAALARRWRREPGSSRPGAAPGGTPGRTSPVVAPGAPEWILLRRRPVACSATCPRSGRAWAWRGTDRRTRPCCDGSAGRTRGRPAPARRASRCSPWRWTSSACGSRWQKSHWSVAVVCSWHMEQTDMETSVPVLPGSGCATWL